MFLKLFKDYKIYKTFIYNRLLTISFVFFILFYFLDFDYYNNLLANDYNYRYKPNGSIIVEHLVNFELFKIDYLNFYLVPELIYGLLQKITHNKEIFSIISNILNISLLFFSFGLFFKTLEIKNRESVILIFLIFFFIYIGNWIWCFWKLADVYFLFIFSVLFYFLCIGLKKNKIKYLLYSLIFCFLSLFSKPQGVLMVPFFLISVFPLYYKEKINFFKFSTILFLIYLIFFPLVIFFLKETNQINIVVTFMSDGNISGILYYKFDQFLEDFSLQESNFSEILYFYFLFIKKIIYQITFIRETYSLNHNVFLIIYTLIFYFFLFINLDYVIKKENIFSKLAFLITLLSILLHSSMGTADEPNRYQLFHLVPLYILASISFKRCLKYTIKYLNE